MAQLPPFFLDCVVAIGKRKPDGTPQWSASGFLYGHFVAAEGEQKRYSLYLITNRHVFAGTETAILRFNPSDDSPAREYDINLVDANGDPKWLAHQDDEIDIAVLPINGEQLQLDGMQFSWFRSDQHVQEREQAISDGVAEGDGVFVLGFPMALVGGDRNYVIARQGAIARIRDWMSSSAKDFLIDVAIFPGNSGGPVVGKAEVGAITGTKAPRASFLLGVVKSYVPYLDVAISQQTGRPRVSFEENSGLASVVPVDYVVEVVASHAKQRGSPPPVEQEAAPPEESRPSTEPSPSLNSGSRARRTRKKPKTQAGGAN